MRGERGDGSGIEGKGERRKGREEREGGRRRREWQKQGVSKGFLVYNVFLQLKYRHSTTCSQLVSKKIK